MAGGPDDPAAFRVDDECIGQTVSRSGRVAAVQKELLPGYEDL
jgi:hypothetical protein